MVAALSPRLNPYYRKNETEVVAELLNYLGQLPNNHEAIHLQAEAFITAVRAQKLKPMSIENFLQTYDLGSREGLALMCLAEAYLRIPDADAQAALIRDKVGSVAWGEHMGKARSNFVNLATLGLATTGGLLKWGLNEDGFKNALGSVTRKLSEPVIRAAIGQAMKLLGQQFVLGETIDNALKRAQAAERRGYRHSYDMLGEGAKTTQDAERYFHAYAEAIKAIANHKNNEDIYGQPSISVKLSALHPRYELAHRDRIFKELYPHILELCQNAKASGIALTIDAEESERLEISLELVEQLAKEPALQDWDGLGLAVQAYQKRARQVIEFLSETAKAHQRRFCVRLVKGAYWDTEIKRAQERGVSDYPVFTRKVNTDLSYMACADAMLRDTTGIYSQFATHNAYTAATIIDYAKRHNAGFEFQRLHGMGEKLHEQVVALEIPCRIYAPVGEHKDLLAYLVRRLLENGANSSFVNKIYDPETSMEALLMNPLQLATTQTDHHNPVIPLPTNLFQPTRRNSFGLDLDNMEELQRLQSYVNDFSAQFPLLNHIEGASVAEDSTVLTLSDPADPSHIVSQTPQLKEADLKAALEQATAAFKAWTTTPPTQRADIIERLGDKLAAAYDEFIALLVYEGGKTYTDAIAEIREAIDFCYYYAQQARQLMGQALPLPGPTGERNELSLHGRGVIACISPWNFPLAIFLGQVTAALVTGNTVIAKPAQQTPTVARRAIELAYEAGIPREVLHFAPAPGRLIGEVLLRDERIAGVAFTGSTDVAWTINQTLAARRCAIAPLIAETGGINAMIVDSSALTEQVVRDIIISAFQSAGQRCSALRLLYIQEDVAAKTIDMLKGALAELQLGHPRYVTTDIGCVIDKNAQKELLTYSDWLKDNATLIAQASVPESEGAFVSPQAWLLTDASLLTKEVFGPILHIVTYKFAELPQVIEQINAKGFGLTLGVHSRIEETVALVRQQAQVGNLYINRSIIGAVVGAQPFGGEGLSGTGPKAGGPHYLTRFVQERTYTQDTTAAGGNASLLASIN
ncbi:bifunctional proline dehydrogenase/L-glutamate gamma-semialdehyde dehydrogenase PutA [Candidatus Odyssella thessalonicensis]|uniref:bifunctional proline dehydrogenase/L-glutamate gamma-semialdehyde dehydrogenase PutA n=1 Tax=Candidatus Odyssella thessalonicensis TaxID=84647 RepID=UPI000225B4BE|nr:bifunctional proline dehydrogenase/L-glutamate gamma-semialdehyde dehydrogenase PutA [Candidatus Odyssella thessalonicensis]